MTSHLWDKAMLKVWKKSWEPFRIYQLTITDNPAQFDKLWPDWLFQYQVGTKKIPIDQLLIAMLDEPSTLYQIWGTTKSCGFKSNFSWKSYSSMNLYIAGIVVYGHVGRKKCGLLVIAGFSFDYERFHLDNKKRVVPMGGMKMGTVHGWMSHFTTHISFVSFETHWMRHRHTVRPSLRPRCTM